MRHANSVSARAHLTAGDININRGISGAEKTIILCNTLAVILGFMLIH
jgi:hypothetical protein